MKKRIGIALALALLAGPAFADSTVNPNIPVTGAPLQSAPMRNNFAAAAADINNILSKFGNPTAPGTPTTFQDWMAISGCPTACQLNMFDGTTWVRVGILNQTAHTYSVALTPFNVIGAEPITVSVSVGAATIGFDYTHAGVFTAAQGINLNGGALPTPQTGTVLQGSNAAGTVVRNELDGYAAAAHYSGVRANGTVASPTTLVSANEIVSLNAFGFDGTANAGPFASFRCFADQTWVHGSANGTYCDIAVTPDGSTTLTQAVKINNDGGVVFGAATGGDKGANTINTAGQPYYQGNALAVSASLPIVLNATTGNVTCPTCATSTLNGAALTETNDTNVTLTLGGTPATALLNAASITAGWTGQLAVSRGGIGVGTLASNGVLYGNGTGAVQALAVNSSGTPNFLSQVSSGAPSWVSSNGSGNVVLTTSPALVTPALGVASATSLAVGGCTIGANALCVTGSASFGATTVTGSFTATGLVTNGDLAGSIAASKLVGTDIATVGTLTAGGTGAGFTVALGTSTLTGQVPLANGGTAANLTASNGGIVYSTASAFAVLPGTVTANQCLLSGSSAAPTWGSCTGGVSVTSVSGTAGQITATGTTSVTISLPSTITSNETLSGTINLSGTVQVGGNAMSFPGVVATLAALNVTDQSLTGGAVFSPYSLSSGSLTVDCGKSGGQWIVNTGAFTITAPAVTPTSAHSCYVRVINGTTASNAAAVTLSGFSLASPGGVSFATTARVSAASVSFTNSSANIGWTANGLPLGTPIFLATTGSLPTNFATATLYYVVTTGTNTIQVSATPGGSAIVAGSAGSGTQTGYVPSVYDLIITGIDGPVSANWTQVQ